MRIRLLFCSLCLAVAVLYLNRKLPGADQNAVVTRIESTVSQSTVLPETSAQASVVADQPKLREERKPEDRAGIRLSLENQAELEHCGLFSGRDVATLDDVVKVLAQEAGKAEKQTLIWRNVHFRAPDGEERRLRVWTDYSQGEQGKLKAQLFTLDEEGLPVPVETVDVELSGQYLERAKIQETQEKTSLSFGEPKHLALTIETKNGLARSLEAKDDSIAFQCFTAPGADATDCKCLSNKASR